MQIIRGTTPTININVETEIDFSQISNIWVYISQMGLVKVDKVMQDTVLKPEESVISLKLSQDDTLKLVKGDALIQIRLLMADGTALANIADHFTVEEIYKDGVIGGEFTG